MNQPTPPLSITTSQTIGPFPHEAWRWAFDPGDPARPVQIEGHVFDGDGTPVQDAVLEAWVPGVSAPGDGPGLPPGFHRTHTDEGGRFRFSLPARGQAEEPACYVAVFARGLLKHQFSAILPPGCSESPLFDAVPVERRPTLVARGDGAAPWRWDLHLQGPSETVFFDFT